MLFQGKNLSTAEWAMRDLITIVCSYVPADRPFLQTLWIGVRDQPHATLGHHPVTVCIHRLELPPCIHMQERKWRLRRVKRLARQVQHDRAVFSDGVQHHRFTGSGHRFTDDFNRFGFQSIHIQFLCTVLRFGQA